MTTRSTRESTHMWKNQLMKTRQASSKTPRCLPYLFIFFLSSFFFYSSSELIIQIPFWPQSILYHIKVWNRNDGTFKNQFSREWNQTGEIFIFCRNFFNSGNIYCMPFFYFHIPFRLSYGHRTNYLETCI